MELRQFAEQVLFGTTLEEKLRCPEEITDEQPGIAIIAPESPGRPQSLKFRAQESAKAEFPGLHRLENQEERGRLLHFFANHELLATELMALVLLRFPDAPAAFRRGVLRTLMDEQEHARLYMERMRACGIEFGELPVSGYFWRSVSGMENPIDYVAGLSLTFEQANLDFSRHYARGFSVVGDAPTAELLDRIYKDEIAHVAYGLKWFRRWKNPTESDWEAFCRQLKFPLSPQRAKGVVFNAEGRRAAGLDPGFIAELQVYAHSKGRTPSVFVFNPFSEGTIALGKAFTPVRAQAQLARDLANLPQFLCRRDDIVLVPERPGTEFLNTIQEAGFELPEFVELSNGQIPRKSALLNRKIGALRPWAWGPDSVELLGPLLGNVSGEARTPEQRFNERTAVLYSKAFSAALLKRLLQVIGREPWLCTEEEAGESAGTAADALELVREIRARGHQRVVVKEALGLAGHNSIRFWEPEITAAQERWVENACARGSGLVVEPWLEREVDFSVQLEMTADGLKLCGHTGLINDLRGQFQANWAAPNHRQRLPDTVIRLFRQPRDVGRRLYQVYDAVVKLLEPELRKADYLGPVGIDAFAYRSDDGAIRLKPVVEINPRYTMGRLTVELMKQACPGSYGLFRIVNARAAQALGQPTLAEYARDLVARFPLRLKGEPQARIREGAVCLNDATRAETCVAIFQVSRTYPELMT